MNIHHWNRSYRQAFTLIELLVVIGLIAAIIVITLPNLLGKRNTGDLTNTASQIAALLRQAQTNSMSQNGGTSWGVHFQGGGAPAPFYALFSSSTYSASSTVGYYRLPNTVGYLSVNSVPSGLVGWWTFDEGSGTSTFDFSGNGNSGNLTCYGTGCSNPTWASSGKAGGALQFTGTAGSSGPGSSVNMSTGVSGLTRLTWTAWIYPTAVNNDQMFITNSDQVGNYFRITSSELFFSAYVAGVQKFLSGTSTLSNNTWYFVASEFDGNNMTIYMNGNQYATTLVSSTIQNLTWGTGAINIGIWKPSDIRPFNGKIDDVRIYNRALSAAEINQIYTSSLDVAFSQISGAASASTSIGLYLLNNSSQQSIISVASSGAVSY